jgi:hypothetical protein
MSVSGEFKTLDDFADAVVAERGGAAAFSAVQRRLVLALAAALKTPAAIEPLAVSRILAELPPVVQRADGQHLDPSRLDDNELAALTALLRKAGTDTPPESGSPQEQIARLLADCSQLHRDLNHARDQMRIALESEAVYRRACDGLLADNARLDTENRALRGQHGVAPRIDGNGSGLSQQGPAENSHQLLDGARPSPIVEQPSNVISLCDAVNAPVVRGDLRSRYPDVDFGSDRSW